MITADELAEHRADAEELMVDIYSIQQSQGPGYADGVEGEVWTELFQTKGYVKVLDGSYAASKEVAGRTAAEVRRRLSIPVTAPAIPAGRISAVPVTLGDTSDPTLMGARLLLDPSQPGSHTTARRISVTEVVT